MTRSIAHPSVNIFPTLATDPYGMRLDMKKALTQDEVFVISYIVGDVGLKLDTHSNSLP